MSLCEVIDRFESGEVSDADLEHPLAGNIAEELAQCKENEQQRVLFSDARVLADHIIERYLVLDQTDKKQMAEVYESEDGFREIGGLKVATKRKLQQILGKDNLGLLFHISNYSKLVPVLANYARQIEESEHITPLHASLNYYLCTHNMRGEKVRRLSAASLQTFTTFDFCSNKSFSIVGKSRNEENRLESMLFGVGDVLSQRVSNARSLLPVRKRILENYVRYVEEVEHITPGMTKLGNYLSSHNLNGDVVKHPRSKSLGTFTTFDFCSNKTFQLIDKKGVKENVLESMLFGVDDVLRQRVLDARSLLPVRKRILENYVGYIEGAERITPGKSPLVWYLRSHTMKGDNTKRNSAESLVVFAQHDFVSNKMFEFTDKKWVGENVLESMLFGVDDVLRQRVLDAHSLLPVRKRILENYVQHIEGAEHITPGRALLGNYLRSHNLNGDEVKKSSAESLSTFTRYDFISNKGIRLLGKDETNENAVLSMVHGIKDEELVAKVKKYNGLES